MRLLCVNHTGAVSGAERSLLELLGGLRETDAVRVACPADGPLADATSALGVPVDAIPGTDGSLRVHPLETPKAVGLLGMAASRTGWHAHRHETDVIHANSIRAGLSCVVAAKLAGRPAVVHVRDRLPRSAIADASLRFITHGARMVVANSEYTADGIRAVAGDAHLAVVHNPVDLTRFDPSRTEGENFRRKLGIAADAFLLGVVAQITPWKGQLDAVGALGILRREGRNVHLLIVGEAKFVSSATRYDNRAYLRELQLAIETEGVGDRVEMLGERDDVPTIMSAVDAVLVPSWEEPFGRVVIEAMALGRPVVATSVGGPAEIITDGQDGILLAPRDRSAWARAIADLADSNELRARLASGGMARAKEFAVSAHVARMRALFSEARCP